MSKKPFFSIIIPALNEETYLPLLLKDLANQTIDDFEVIIIDGQSTDKTVTNAKKYEDKLPSLTILTSKIRNVSVQRNMGAEKAKGEYLLFNDADNNLPSHYLEGIRYNLHVKPVDIFTVWCVPDSEETYDKAVATYLNIMIEGRYQLGNPAALGAMIGCRTNIFGRIGGFNPEVGFAEDTEFVQRGYKMDYSFNVFHEPRFVYSFRRFRKIGKLDLIQKYVILNLKYIAKRKVDQKKEYPMGGEIFTGDEKTESLLKSADNSFSTLLKKPKILDRIKALLSLEED